MSRLQVRPGQQMGSGEPYVGIEAPRHLQPSRRSLFVQSSILALAILFDFLQLLIDDCQVNATRLGELGEELDGIPYRGGRGKRRRCDGQS